MITVFLLANKENQFESLQLFWLHFFNLNISAREATLRPVVASCPFFFFSEGKQNSLPRGQLNLENWAQLNLEMYLLATGCSRVPTATAAPVTYHHRGPTHCLQPHECVAFADQPLAQLQRLR